MPSTRTRYLRRLPIEALLAVLAFVATATFVWTGGLTLLQWSGIADPSRNETRTALGIGATTIASGLVSGWPTARDYFVELHDSPAGTDGPSAGTDGPPAGTDGPPAGTDGPPAGTDD